MRRRSLWWSLLLLMVSVSVQAKIVYVNQSATGTIRDGASWATAYHTLTEGLAAAGSGDEVWVVKGTYKEKNLQPYAGVSLYGGFDGTETQRSQRDISANETVLDGGGLPGTDAVVMCPLPNITVDGFHIRNAYDGVVLDSTGTSVVYNNTISDIAVHGVITSNSTAIIAYNTFISVYGNAVTVSDGTATIANNTISRSGNGGIYVYLGTAYIQNNTIAGNPNNGVTVYSGTAAITNNIMAFNGNYGVEWVPIAGGVVSAFSHNDTYGNTRGNFLNYTPPEGQGNISLDPLFVDRANEDLHLQPGSPCIDAGLDDVVTPSSTDRDGEPRVIGAHVDIGAYEYGTVGPPPFTLADVTRCLGIACGLEASSLEDLSRLNVEPGPALDLLDAARLAHKVAGLEPNP